MEVQPLHLRPVKTRAVSHLGRCTAKPQATSFGTSRRHAQPQVHPLQHASDEQHTLLAAGYASATPHLLGAV